MSRRAAADPAQGVAALVLAAGFSSRMGAFKPLLPFGERTLIGHVVETLRQAGLGRIHVVTGFRRQALAPELARLEVVEAHNADFVAGMFSSVQIGVASLPADIDAFLLWPVDVPLPRASTVARMLAAAAASDAAIVYPTFRGKRGHPPLIRRSLFAKIIAGGDEGGKGGKGVKGGLRALLARREDQAQDVAVFDRGCLMDMDSPADHRRLSAALPLRRMPDAEECEAMLEAAGAPEPVRRHCRAVAVIAASLAGRLKEAGAPLDVDLARAAALVHDIAKGRPSHAEAGAALVSAFGFPEVAEAVGRHTSLAFDAGRIDESAIVYLADKVIQGERLVSLETRFAPTLARFADDPAALAGARARLASAKAVADAIEARIGRLEPSLGAPVKVAG